MFKNIFPVARDLPAKAANQLPKLPLYCLKQTTAREKNKPKNLSCYSPIKSICSVRASWLKILRKPILVIVAEDINLAIIVFVLLLLGSFALNREKLGDKF